MNDAPPAARPTESAAGPAVEHERPAHPAIHWQLPRIHPEGWRFVGPAAGAALVALLLGWTPLFWLLAGAAGACAFFFRDPERVPSWEPGVLLSPADGLVVRIAQADVPPELSGPGGLEPGRRLRISVFLSVFDVHVNRTPVAGTVRYLGWVRGAHGDAGHDAASDMNERAHMVLEALDGTRVGVTQVAGLVARRIVRFVHEGAMLAAGQRFGLIRFGSRVDLWCPPGYEPVVRPGQRAVAGETVLARKAP
ncbi:MAG: phosphatidylserine decarboxylase [Sphingomonadaceae bacterium]|uniref:phosphatidylserine decarboxylase n=1 Tax=Thermaurantiacus sp. TaxID=2820283 RepID=UPI00298F3651|nr:phosphatidylserine decarboxylase [Thermaurantiacus sp.]MCS6985954.1 phosphatidylserine decarboxylase [Sphingomonadaceae bacterium]MDW8414830.1 phosphatidylserine decarboxylase [Thermaurantiacus sp.]